MGLKFDKTQFSSSIPSYRNYRVQEDSVLVSGSIPNGGREFSTSFILQRDGTRSDIYYTNNQLTGKRLLNQNIRVQIDGALNANSVIEYAGNTLTVGVYVINFGASTTVNTQTYTFRVVEYDSPLSAI